jgi:hypothetical protein
VFRRFTRRPFSDTSSALPEVTTLDLCYLTDLRFPGGTSTSLATEIRAAHRAGYRVGVLQVDSSLCRNRMTHPLLQTALDAGEAIRIRPGEPVRARLTLVRHPHVLAQSLNGRLPLDTDQVVMICGQVPVDGDGRLIYVPNQVHANCEEATGCTPTWWPVSAKVRASLSDAELPLAAEDWVETIDLSEWPVVPVRTITTGTNNEESPHRVYAIGRHGRDHPMKWPADPDVIRMVYPEVADIEVRILGGATHPVTRLGGTPANWSILGYGTVSPADFLAGLDGVVYFPHPDLIEAFGRNVLEALASGVVTVAPPQIAAAFRGACIAAEPEDAIPALRELWSDPSRWVSVAETGRRIVEEHFSTDVFTARLAALCGPPEPTSPMRAAPNLDLVPPGLRSQRPVILFTLFGADAQAVESTLQTLAAARDRECGFHPILVINGPRPTLASELGVMCTSVTGQRTWQGEGTWPEYLRRRLRQLASAHRADWVTPCDLSSPLAWISLGVHIERTDDVDSAEHF